MKLRKFLTSPKNRETLDKQRKFIAALFFTQLAYLCLAVIGIFTKGHWETWIAYLEIMMSAIIVLCSVIFAIQIIFNDLGLKLISRVESNG